jgi:uncharacterized membrane-anchored protein YjiN (DUF445 family)
MSVTTVTTTPPPVRRQEEREARLRVMKRRATGLLVVVAIAYVLALVLTDDTGAAGYVRATLEASMVGGLADWFAVTALFRRPLGLPIPHTAVIAERKDQFGETLGQFVQEHFLSAEVVGERVRGAGVSARAAAWLCDRRNAESLAGHAATLLVRLADAVREEEADRLVDEALRRGLDRLPVSALAGRALRVATAEGRHRELVDAALDGLDRFLDENHDALRERFGTQSPWWLPGAVEDRIFDRLLDGVRNVLRDPTGTGGHQVRDQLDAWLAGLADRLEHDEVWIARGEQLKRDVLDHPELRQWTGSIWADAKAALRAQAGDPDSELRARLADAAVAAGTRLAADDDLKRQLDGLVVGAVRAFAEQFHHEIVGLVSGTIARWDGEETSRRLELLLGHDLQFIRINGTVVGGLAGLLIHTIAEIAA